MGNENVSVKKEKAKLFETVFSSPGMSDYCKISLKISRQNILLLGRLIETGIINPQSRLGDEIFSSLSEKSTEEFKTIHEEILKKSELTEFYEKLKTF